MLGLIPQNVSARRQAGIMPGSKHQAIIQILRDEPQLVAMLLGQSGFKTPCGSYPVIADSDLSHRTPRLLKELRADNVFLFPGMYETIAVVVEVQTTPPNSSRLLTWPCYVTSARLVHGCKTYMLVIATSKAVSTGSATLIDIGQPGFRFLPFVAGGHRRLPPGGGLVYGPELMMLNILTGAFKLTTHTERMLALASIRTAYGDRYLWYAQLLREYTSKNKRISRALEELMETTFKDVFAERHREQGRVEGRVEGREEGREEGMVEAASSVLLAVLAACGFTVVDQVRTLISTCSDPAQLERWATRAVMAGTLEEVFEGYLPSSAARS
jgi:hypothetical protein